MNSVGYVRAAAVGLVFGLGALGGAVIPMTAALALGVFTLAAFVLGITVGAHLARGGWHGITRRRAAAPVEMSAELAVLRAHVAELETRAKLTQHTLAALPMLGATAALPAVDRRGEGERR